MNEFGTPRFEHRVSGSEPQTRREEVEAVLRELPPDTDTRSELDAVRRAMEQMVDHSGKEFYALQVRRAALLEFERGRELPRHRPTASVADAPDIPTLSPELERRHPIFGQPLQKPLANTTFVHEGLRDAGPTIPRFVPADRADEDDNDGSAEEAIAAK